jgi:gamma-glutamyltranspeptidase/glutathione hydrolase
LRTHARHGTLPLARCLEDAIHYARDGFPVSARLSRWIGQTAGELDDASAAAVPARGPSAASRHTATKPQPGANAGSDRCAGSRPVFNGGEVAKQLAALGGFFRESDLAAQRAYWGEPICGSYRGATIYETPAPTQGFTVLEMLNLLEPLELARREFLGPDHVHLLVQAKQIAYHDRDRWLADPEFRSGAHRAPCIEGLCRFSPRADRPCAARALRGTRSLPGEASPATRCTSQRWMRTAMRPP